MSYMTSNNKKTWSVSQSTVGVNIAGPRGETTTCGRSDARGERGDRPFASSRARGASNAPRHDERRSRGSRFRSSRVSIARTPRAPWRSGAHAPPHEQAAGLADAAGGAEDGDLVPAGLLHRLGGGAGNAGGAEKSGHGVSGEGLWVSARLTMAIGTLPDTDVTFLRFIKNGESDFGVFKPQNAPRLPKSHRMGIVWFSVLISEK